mmetsp:Transcript_33105/g.75589  ORF Transcript_33105/g.75589 Transcript_33105/m.75589 type:complete len:861 (+) Transcript_33105:270-2852(+)
MKNKKYRKIKMSCNRGRKYVDQLGQRSRERSSKGDIKTTKPTTREHECGFYLTVYLRLSDGRCFVKKNQNTCWHHSHHTQVPRSLMREGAESLSNKTLETVEKMLEKNMPTNFVKEFVAIEDDIKLSDGSIEALRRQVAMNDFEGDSSGEKLVNDLTKKEGTEFVMLTGSFDQAMQQTRVNMTRRKVLAHNKLSAPHKQSVDVDKLGDKASDHVKNVVLGLSLGDGEYLIAIAWCTAEQREWHRKFPFVFGNDETFRSNDEDRPLSRLCGLSMNGNLLPFVEAFIPSRQKWVFNWLWTVAFPSLLDPEALKKTCIILVDQDERNWEVIQSVLRTSDVYGCIAVARLCNWHKINRNFVVKVRVHKKSNEDRYFFDEVTKWLYSFSYSVKSIDQMDDSMAKLEAFCVMARKNEVSGNLVDATEKYIRESFKPDLSRLCQCYYSDIPHGNVASNSFSESNNAMLLSSANVKPNNKLNVTGRKINDAADRRYNQLKSDAVASLNKSSVAIGGKGAVGTPDSAVSQNIVDAMVKRAKLQYDLSQRHNCCVTESSDEHVNILVRPEDTNRTFNHLHPVYHQTHKVVCSKVEASDGNDYWCFSCGCNEDYHKEKCPCSHVYCALGSKPHESHFYPECTKQYEVCYGDPKYENFTRDCDVMRLNIMEYPGLLVPAGEFTVPPVDDIASVRKFLEKPADPCDVNSKLADKLDPEKVAEFKLAPRTRKRKRGSNPFTENLAQYEHIMKLIRSKEDQEFVADMFNKIEMGLYSRKRPSGDERTVTVPPGPLGVSVGYNEPGVQGARVTAVAQSSPLKSKVKPGDTIVANGDKLVKARRDLEEGQDDRERKLVIFSGPALEKRSHVPNLAKK